MNPKVDEFLSKAKKWQAELEQLRAIILDCGLDEDFKWKHPCYTYKSKNLLIIGGFKEYCVLSFLKGALLSDSNKLLQQQTENSQSVRIIKFTNVKNIVKLTPILKAYIFEAIEAEKAGLKVVLKKSTDWELCEELENKLNENKVLKTAFNKLTPGRQRAYSLYFSAAKQVKTRITRIEQYIPKILSGKGLNDCTCGLSKRLPNCDGSHKYIK